MVAYGQEIVNDKNDFPAQLLMINLMKRKDLSSKMKDYNASILRTLCSTKEKFNQPKALDALAELEATSGNFTNAVDAEKRALKRADELKDDANWKPLLSETTLENKNKIKRISEKAVSK